MKRYLILLSFALGSCAAFRPGEAAAPALYQVTVLLEPGRDPYMVFRTDWPALAEPGVIRPKQVTITIPASAYLGPDELRERLNASGLAVLDIRKL